MSVLDSLFIHSYHFSIVLVLFLSIEWKCAFLKLLFHLLVIYSCRVVFPIFRPSNCLVNPSIIWLSVKEGLSSIESIMNSLCSSLRISGLPTLFFYLCFSLYNILRTFLILLKSTSCCTFRHPKLSSCFRNFIQLFIN